MRKIAYFNAGRAEVFIGEVSSARGKGMRFSVGRSYDGYEMSMWSLYACMTIHPARKLSIRKLVRSAGYAVLGGVLLTTAFSSYSVFDIANAALSVFEASTR